MFSQGLLSLHLLYRVANRNGLSVDQENSSFHESIQKRPIVHKIRFFKLLWMSVFWNCPKKRLKESA
jgi:hypothetical protein